MKLAKAFFNDIRKLIHSARTTVARGVDLVKVATNFEIGRRIVQSLTGQSAPLGVQELDMAKLSPLLKLKYNNAIADAVKDLGRAEEIGAIFAGFQQYLYA